MDGAVAGPQGASGILQAESLRVDGNAVGPGAPEGFDERMVARKPRHVCLGDATAHVDEAKVAWQRGVLERREGDDLRAGGFEQLEVFRVVEGERVVEGHADAHRFARSALVDMAAWRGMHGRRIPP